MPDDVGASLVYIVGRIREILTSVAPLELRQV